MAERAAGRGLGRLYRQTHRASATARALQDKVAVDEGFLGYALDLPG